MSRRTVLLLLVAVASIAAGSLAWATDALRRPELDSVDLRFSLRGDHAPRDDVVVVGIDDVSFADLDARWPFRRNLHARAIDRLRRAGAKVIAYDIQFTEASEFEEDDLALFDAVRRAGNVVLATTEVDDEGGTAVLGGDDNVRAARARVGNAYFQPDPGGVFRRILHQHQGLKSFAVVSAERATGKPVGPGRFDAEDGSAWIDFTGESRRIPYYSFSRLLDGKVPESQLRGKIVVVGAVAPTIQDVHPTSIAGRKLMSGAEIQANAIATVLDDFPLREPPGWVALLAIVVAGLSTPLAAIPLRGAKTLLVALGALAVYAVGAQFAFNAGVIVPVLPPVLALVLSAIGVLGVYYTVEVQERRRLRTNFGRFVPPAIIDAVISHADGLPRLPSERREATVLFTDLRSFTTVAERLEVEQVIEMLNRFTVEMSEAILDEGGTVVACMGDGLMAVFGAPLDQADHADRALTAARRMLDERLPRFNAWLADNDIAHEFRLGIGLNSGPVMSGTVGNERRLEYEVVGDTTNTASRIEGMTKEVGTALLLSDSTRRRLRSAGDELVEAGSFTPRGRQASIVLWTEDRRRWPDERATSSSP